MSSADRPDSFYPISVILAYDTGDVEEYEEEGEEEDIVESVVVDGRRDWSVKQDIMKNLSNGLIGSPSSDYGMKQG